MLSLFLSLIFLVHPINVESVSYIGASQSELYFLFGILALLVSVREKIYLKHLFLVSGLLLLSLLTKETGFLFLLLVLLFQFLFNKKRALNFFLCGLVTLPIYFFIRFTIGGVFFEKFISRVPLPIASLSFLARLANIPAIVLYYLTTMFFPLKLAVDQRWVVTKLTVNDFYLPLLLDSVFFIALCIGGVYIYTHKRIYFKAYLFFFLWFLTGLLLLLQIFPLDMTVADRWFYFPIVGMLGTLGVGVETILFSPNKYGNFLLKSEKAKMVAALFGVTLITLLSLRTIVRSTNLHDNLTLFTHDAQIQDNPLMEDTIGVLYYQTGKPQASLIHLQKSINLYPYTDNLLHLGNWYESQGNLQKAQEYYVKALTYQETYYLTANTNRREKENDLDIYVRLAGVLLLSGEHEAAEKISKKGLEYYPDSIKLWEELAVSESKLHNWKGALDAVEKAKTLSTSDLPDFLYTQMVKKHEIQPNMPMIIMNQNQ